jgi:hypothetical protein
MMCLGQDAEMSLDKLINAFQGNQIDALKFLNEQVLREQEIYWSRFVAFATLNAGAFVLIASEAIKTSAILTVLSVAGIGLALLWGYVQWISLRYVDRTKPLYHELRSKMGFSFAPSQHPIIAGIHETKWLSSTNIGVWVPILVTAMWVCVVIGM